MDFTLRDGYWIKFCMKLISVMSHNNTTVSFIALFVNWCNDRLLPLIRQFFLIPIGMNELMDLR
jgi:hypothetical protein